MQRNPYPDPPYEPIIGICKYIHKCSLTIRKSDIIMRVLKDNGSMVDIDVSRLEDVPARTGDRVEVAAVPIQQGYYDAVYCINRDTNRVFSRLIRKPLLEQVLKFVKQFY